MNRIIFVGERPSLKAARYGHTWEGANAAARTLHNALDAVGVDREARAFVNLWTRPGVGKPAHRPSRNAVRQVREAVTSGARVVALGQLVAAELEARRIPHVRMVHPAARGKIRKRERYIEHVREVLG
jgi:uracil-DNA glycosylase